MAIELRQLIRDMGVFRLWGWIVGDSGIDDSL